MSVPALSRILALTFALVAVALPASAQSMRVGVVDTQRAVMETEDGLRMQATLKKVFDNRQRELDKKQDELKKEHDDIQKQQDVLSKEAFSKRLEKWQREMAQLQQVFVEYNQELQKKQSELAQPIYQKAMGIIRRLAMQEGFDVVVDKQALAYSRSDLDLTDRVIALYNQGAPGDSGDTKAPAPSKNTAPKTLTPPALTPPVAPK